MKPPPPIDDLFPLAINDTQQWVLVRGNRIDAPIALFVHGGPGYPLMWFAKEFDTSLYEEFLVVHWDQRGAGKSYSADCDPKLCTLDQIVSDGIAVVEQLANRFGPKRTLLLGHSWGTVVASHMATKRPDLFHAYVSIGTVGNLVHTDRWRYDYAYRRAESGGDESARAGLVALGPPPYPTSEGVVRFGELFSQVTGFSGASQKHTEEDLSRAVLECGFYSEAELEAAFEGLKHSLECNAEFLSSYDQATEVPRVEIPVLFVQGGKDLNTPPLQARAYFDLLEAPKGKEWVEFPAAGHLTMYDEPSGFLGVLQRAIGPR